MIIINITLLIIAGLSNAVMDISSENRFWKPWMNKSEGWKNKWKLGDPKYGEKFIGSSTVFVLFTDLWHFAQFIFHTSWQLLISLQFEKWYLYFIGIKIIFGVIFELTYRLLKRISKY